MGNQLQFSDLLTTQFLDQESLYNMIKLFYLWFLWINYSLFVSGNIMNDDFVCISNFKLTDTPILEMKPDNSSIIKCFAQCLRMENCKSVSVKRDSSTCRLYDVSVAAIGSSPERDADWDTFTYKGWLVFF